MKVVIAILGLVACATAFQFQKPQYGQYRDENVLTGIYDRFHGPYNTRFYQRRFGGEYPQEQQEQQKQNIEEVYNRDQVYNQYGNQDSNIYQNLFNKYYQGMYDKYMGKVQDYLKDYQTTDESITDYPHKENRQTTDRIHQQITKKQEDVYQLFKYINNPMYNTEHQQMYKNFEIQQYAQYYQLEAFKSFVHLWENKMFLPKGEIFSIFNDVHVEQVKVLFRLLYTAKDYETFFKTALWAREHINEGMFLYTFSVALMHRNDTKDVVLPPIYEIYPQYFFNSEVMQKAYQYKMSHYGNRQQERENVYTIRANYSGHYLNLNPEQSLSYYLEDVGMNAFYYYHNLHFPYWMEAEELHVDGRRGEIFLYVHQQIVARYYLERLSHGIGGIDYFNWELPFETGYYPSLTYPNGLKFTERPNFANLQEYFANYGQRWCFISKYGYGFTYVETYEQRIREAIDLGFVYTLDGKKVDLYTSEGLPTLGNIIEGNADSVNSRYYGSYVNFARHLLGYSKQPLDNYKLAPSALEHYETSLRDPAFYKLFKKVTLLAQKYKHNLPSYTKDDLYYQGVKVERFEIDQLVTFYDKFYADITNGLYVTPEEYTTDSTFRVQVQQYRLNNKNFNYKVYVNSQQQTDAFVKVFIGPKYDEHGRMMDFYENRMNFFEMDRFRYTLKAGQNTIVRNSKQFTWYAQDRTSFLNLYKNVMSYNQENEEVYEGAPLRFVLPRGTEEGMTYQVYVIVYPQQKQQTRNVQTNRSMMMMMKLDNPRYYPLGYPFDRPAEFENVYLVPNAYMKDVKIYHKVLKTENFETEEFMQRQPKYFM